MQSKCDKCVAEFDIPSMRVISDCCPYPKVCPYSCEFEEYQGDDE